MAATKKTPAKKPAKASKADVPAIDAPEQTQVTVPQALLQLEAHLAKTRQYEAARIAAGAAQYVADLEKAINDHNDAHAKAKDAE